MLDIRTPSKEEEKGKERSRMRNVNFIHITVKLTSPMVRMNNEISQVIGNDYFYFPRTFRDIKCRTLIKMIFKVLKNNKKVGESDCKIIFTGFLSSNNLLTQQLKAILRFIYS